VTPVSRHIAVADEEAMLALGARLAACRERGAVIFLHGDLGAGKTTLVRGFLRGLGFAGAVTSPTYTLVEPYSPDGENVYHFDLYRLGDPDELEYLGARDYFDGSGVTLIEWPERAEGALASPDLHVSIEYAGTGRRVELEAATERGRAMLQCLEQYET
jgi:tRNA threonylcarbamoyladenosine biosynthesis protein TsaE